MTVDFEKCERVRVTAEGQEVLAFLGRCDAAAVELTLVDQATRKAWYSKFTSKLSPRLYFATELATFIAEQLCSTGEADRALISRMARQQIIKQRRLRALSQEKARALFDAAFSIPNIAVEDDWPEAVLELAYGLDWRARYPRLRDPAFQTLFQHVTLLQKTLVASST
ncbi:hypothetical protein [Pseudomonas sp. GXZC]|uniref:hypothetical protein n=1 Tax=Pseudomonas sp. GXZC TaxID=3003351 RepID=UPI0022AA0465|nr:hypothetical protein [Pseudomonas sp. GXZC]WAT32225.1 hypothetical protein OZ428_33645 [Pseudomonas sp. GXZC]